MKTATRRAPTAADRRPERREAYSRSDSAESAGGAPSAPPVEELTVAHRPLCRRVDGRGSIVACGELAPLSHSLAEVRSLVVSEKRRGEGLGRRVVDELAAAGQSRAGTTTCASSHISRHISRTWAFRSFRTPGCRRRSRPIAGLARCSGAANNSRWSPTSMRYPRPNPRSGACLTPPTAHRNSHSRSIDGGITAPAGFHGGGCLRGHQAEERTPGRST